MIKQFLELSENENSFVVQYSSHEDYHLFYDCFNKEGFLYVENQEIDFPRHYIQFNEKTFEYLIDKFKDNIV